MSPLQNKVSTQTTQIKSERLTGVMIFAIKHELLQDKSLSKNIYLQVKIKNISYCLTGLLTLKPCKLSDYRPSNVVMCGSPTDLHTAVLSWSITDSCKTERNVKYQSQTAARQRETLNINHRQLQDREKH